MGVPVLLVELWVSQFSLASSLEFCQFRLKDTTRMRDYAKLRSSQTRIAHETDELLVHPHFLKLEATHNEWSSARHVAGSKSRPRQASVRA